MKIVVLGGGTVGSSIAELLCQNRHSVTVVESNAADAARLNETLDVKAIHGSAAQSTILFQAGVLDADLCLAVTGVDEVNLVAASLARAMGTGRTVARVFAPVFRDLSTFDYQRHFGIDRLLSLEHLSAMELARGIRHPGSVTVENLARGQLEVQELHLEHETDAIGVPLREMKLPKGVRIGSLAREDQTWIPVADDRLQLGDRLTLLGEHENINKVKNLFRIDAGPKIGVVIAGGGETGYHLARALENLRCHVVLMEADQARCEFLSRNLKKVTVVLSDATRAKSLEEERVGSADVFAACMGEDENNIMAGVEARELGARTIMAIVSRPDYANVVAKLGIDHTVSPREVMAKQVLGFLQPGPIVSRTPLGKSGVSVLEIDVRANTPATEHVLAALQLPPQCLIAAVLQGSFARVPGADDRLQPGDTVIVMVENSVIDAILPVFTTGGRTA